MDKNYFHEIVFSRLALSIFIIIMFVLVAFFNQPSANVVNNYDISGSKLILPNGNVIAVEIADTFKQRSKGLSGRDNLNADSAMLFVFDKESYYSFWMLDMNFPIDIVWLDSEYKVVDIAKNIKPMPELTQNDLPTYLYK